MSSPRCPSNTGGSFSFEPSGRVWNDVTLRVRELDQCDYIVLFLNDLGKKIVTKVAQIFGNLGYFKERPNFLIKNCFAYF